MPALLLTPIVKAFPDITQQSVSGIVGAINAVLIFILVVFIGRLFYLQIIRHDYYRSAAQVAQLKEYEIPAERGLIKAYENGLPVPLVLRHAWERILSK